MSFDSCGRPLCGREDIIVQVICRLVLLVTMLSLSQFLIRGAKFLMYFFYGNFSYTQAEAADLARARSS